MISGIIQEVFSPSGNQLIAEETRKKLARCMMVWGRLPRASCANPVAKCWPDAKLRDQVGEVLGSAVLWSLSNSRVQTCGLTGSIPEVGTRLCKQQSAARWPVANLALSHLMGLVL